MSFRGFALKPGKPFQYDLPENHTLFVRQAALANDAKAGSHAKLQVVVEAKAQPLVVCRLRFDGQEQAQLDLPVTSSEVQFRVEGNCGVDLIGYEEVDMSDSEMGSDFDSGMDSEEMAAMYGLGGDSDEGDSDEEAPDAIPIDQLPEVKLVGSAPQASPKAKAKKGKANVEALMEKVANGDMSDEEQGGKQKQGKKRPAGDAQQPASKKQKGNAQGGKKGGAQSPKQGPQSPKATPQKGGAQSPKQAPQSPKQGAQTPKKGAQTPKKGAQTPGKKGAQTPGKQGGGAPTPAKKGGAPTPAKKGGAQSPAKKGGAQSPKGGKPHQDTPRPKGKKKQQE